MGFGRLCLHLVFFFLLRKHTKYDLIRIHFVSSCWASPPEASFVAAFRNSIHDTKYKNAHKQYVYKSKQHCVVGIFFCIFHFDFSLNDSPLTRSFYSVLSFYNTYGTQAREFRWLLRSSLAFFFSVNKSQYKYVCINWFFCFFRSLSFTSLFFVIFLLLMLCSSSVAPIPEIRENIKKIFE